jgi:hypothetical protein
MKATRNATTIIAPGGILTSYCESRRRFDGQIPFVIGVETFTILILSFKSGFDRSFCIHKGFLKDV